MTYNDVRKNENKGFSLVELIVVVAIMAVLVAVLAPSLLAYVERTRAQKDDSAMGEVTNAIMLALADQKVYDEVLRYTFEKNVSCYVDGNGGSNQVGTLIFNEGAAIDAEGAQYIYGDDARVLDETPFKFAGNMRGMTITFSPDSKDTKKTEYVLANGAVNAGTHSISINDAEPAEKTLGAMSSIAGGQDNHLYNRVRATVGDKITLTSQTYRNSQYTVFIRMGTTGGNQPEKQDAIKVYGQWSGTNLDAKAE